jgi:hypothetical protein
MLLLITLPVLAVFGVFAWLANSPSEDLMLAIPGLVALPILAIAPCVNGRLVPLSRSSEEAAAIVGGYTKRRVIGGLMVTFLPFIVSGLGALAQFLGWFWWFVAAEAFLAIALYIGLRLRMASLRWRPVE